MSKNTKPKFQFGESPESFKRDIEVVNIHGAESVIEVEFIYRTKSQFAKLADEGLQQAKAKLDKEKEQDEDQFSLEKISSNFYSESNTRTVRDSAEYIMKIAKSWDLVEPLSIASLERLEDHCSGTLQTIAKTYAKAVNEVRTKNL